MTKVIWWLSSPVFVGAYRNHQVACKQEMTSKLEIGGLDMSFAKNAQGYSTIEE